jgi:monothiol glutaredoxin
MDNQTKTQIESEISSQDVVLFMKGTPVFPQCGFSAAVVGVLSHLGIKYKGVNVLEDDAVREGIKEFANWPTIPQLYIKGEFVGGCDIIREMYESGELNEMFSSKGIDVDPQPIEG